MLSSPPVDPAAPEIQAGTAVFAQVTFQTGHEWKKQHCFSFFPGKKGLTITVYGEIVYIRNDTQTNRWGLR